MNSIEGIDEYVAASGAPELRGEDLELLERYASAGRALLPPRLQRLRGRLPRGVDIAEVLRTRMYDVDYGDPALAVEDYAKLGEPASACLRCVHQACLGACPYGIPIPEFTRDAATRLG